MGFATPKACFVCFSVYAFCFRRLLSSIIPFSSITYINLATPCRLLKWLGPFSRPQVNALRSEFYFVGCQDGGHALKIFLLYLLIYFVYVGCMWRSEENLWVPGLAEGSLSCFVNSIPLCLLFGYYAFQSCFPFCILCFTMFSLILWEFQPCVLIIFFSSSSAPPRPSLRSLPTQLHVLSFPLKDSFFSAFVNLSF